MTREEEINEAASGFGLWYVAEAMFKLGAEWADEHPHKPTREEILDELHAHAEHTERLYNSMGQIPPLEQLAILQIEEGRKQAIEKAVNWLSLNAELYGGFNPGKLNDLVVAFKKSMKE